jgi:hypothetical protein
VARQSRRYFSCRFSLIFWKIKNKILDFFMLVNIEINDASEKYIKTILVVTATILKGQIMKIAISSLYSLKKKSVAAILCGLMLHTSITIASEPVQPPMRIHDCRYNSNFDSSLPVESVDQNRGWFPTNDLFRPLLADLKEPQFLISRWRVKPNEANDFAAAAVGFGESFGLYRFGLSGGRPCNGFQLNISGAVFAQFNLNTPSSDLVNADYIIGFPLTFRIADFSARLRLYHQSSHLGDEFILGSAGVERVNLSFEELEAILSYIRHFFRVYGGSGYLVHREPDLERLKWQYGMEVRLQALKTRGFRLGGHPVFFVAGSDIKHFQHHNYDVNYSIKAGFEIFGNVSQRRLRLLAGFYKGFNPFGQFYDQRVRAFGFEIDLGF